MNEIRFIGSLYNQHSRWGVFDKNGICPTLTAACGMGGGHVPMIIVEVKDDKNKTSD